MNHSARPGYRAIVDETLCIASGQCELYCPEEFTVGDVALPRSDRIADEHLDAARDAADACPAQAITLVQHAAD